MKLHESGCFFYTRNGVYVRKLPRGTKNICFYVGKRKIECYMVRKIFYIDTPDVEVEVEWEDPKTGNVYMRYFSYHQSEGFVEDET